MTKIFRTTNIAGVRHGRGVQGAAGPDGGEAQGDEAGGKHLQEDCKPHSEWTNWHLTFVICPKNIWNI